MIIKIYLPFDKSILLYGSTRLEFGRDDEYVWWRRSMMGPDSKERWKHWVRNLKAIAGSKSNFIAANNLYDVTYIEYLTGVETTHIPSWCGDDPDFLAHRIRYEPRRPEIVLTPYRLNLEYSREDIPETGWPNHRRQKSRASPLRHKLFDDLHVLIRSKAHGDAFNIIDMKQAFPRRGKFKKRARVSKLSSRRARPTPSLDNVLLPAVSRERAHARAVQAIDGRMGQRPPFIMGGIVRRSRTCERCAAFAPAEPERFRRGEQRKMDGLLRRVSNRFVSTHFIL